MFDKFGTSKELRIADMPMPEPKEDEVQIHLFPLEKAQEAQGFNSQRHVRRKIILQI